MTAVWLARSATIYVATNGVDARTGLDYWTNAVATISNGVAKAASAGDVVLVSNGTYVLATQVSISAPVTVQSFHNGAVDQTNTIVNGNAATRCFTIANTGAVVNGFTIYNGRATSEGGGIALSKGTVRNCIIVSNVVDGGGYGGGGIYVSNYTNVVENCLIAYNTATNGAGIYFYYTASGIVTNCVIRDNWTLAGSSGGSGGGILMGGDSFPCVLANSIIYNNRCTNTGGGVYTDRVYAKIVGCNIYSNYANSGGGVLMNHGLITNCNVSNNICNTFGGGICASYSDASIVNCRVTGNSSTNTAAGHYGGGVRLSGAMMNNCIIRDNYSGYGAGGVDANNSAGIRNCLVAGNSALVRGGGMIVENLNLVENCTVVSNSCPDGGGVWALTQAGGTNYLANCIIYYNISSGSASNYSHAWGFAFASYSNCCLAPAISGTSQAYSSNNITADPRFIGWTNGDYRLRKGSPCINAGVNQAWMNGAFDLDGHRRVDKFSGIVDIGCYEYMPNGTLFTVR